MEAIQNKETLPKITFKTTLSFLSKKQLVKKQHCRLSTGSKKGVPTFMPPIEPTSRIQAIALHSEILKLAQDVWELDTDADRRAVFSEISRKMKAVETLGDGIVIPSATKFWNHYIFLGDRAVHRVNNIKALAALFFCLGDSIKGR